MSSYYHIVEGNLRPGDIAKSSDINHIQVHIQDALKGLLSDMHDGESYIVGSGEEHKNDFTISLAPKTLGRYIDTMNYFEITDNDNYVNVNNFDIKQPIPKTKTSTYSIIFAAKNDSDFDITLNCELRDSISDEGQPLRENTVTIPAKKSDKFEVVFDLDYYPTAPGLTEDLLTAHDGKDIPLDTIEESYDEGYEYAHEEERPNPDSNGVSLLYFVIRKVGKNQADLKENGDEDKYFDPENSLGIYYNNDSSFTEQKISAYVRAGTDWEQQSWNIFYEDVYSNNSTTYLCNGIGEAVIDGEKVSCLDHSFSIDGASSYGNVLSEVYLGSDGHIYVSNSKAAETTNINEFEIDEDDRRPMASLLIAKILTYADLEKEPLIIQDDEHQDTRPRSHHERLRRLEKHLNWLDDIAVPSRIKYTLSGKSWVDETGELIQALKSSSKTNGTDPDNIGTNYITTVDANGNTVIRLTKAEVKTIPVTLKESFKNADGTKKVLEENDVLNISQFSEIKNIEHDNKNGTLALKTIDSSKSGVGTNAKQAKKTTLNPWDDSAANRPSGTKITPTEREYTVIKGQGHDNVSKYPAMTFYTNTNYKMTGLTIPIKKFQNCSGIKFFIWKRQNTNNKKNTVWLEKKLYTSKVFSLKNAKTKGKYQYVDEGFTIEFGKGGLSLPKAQYVIIALPIPKENKGSCFVETYKPKNSKDFCIEYKGASNASHFLLNNRFQEIWYNSATATVVEEDYQKEGQVISGSINWTGKSLEKIRYIKPIANLTTPKGCSVALYGDTGNGWQKLDFNKDNEMTGGPFSFKWKLVFKGNGKATPTLKFDNKKGYAIQFTLTRNAPKVGNQSESNTLDKNMCLTSVPIDGDEILRQYIGDNNLGKTDRKFSNFEFARLWATPEGNKGLLIDIAASDNDGKYPEGVTSADKQTFPLWTLHYCDLSLDDFSKINVDYSNYEEELEYDENNMRLKLDTAHSYNDEDIRLFTTTSFQKITNSIDSSEDSKITFINSNVKDNQIFLKATFDNPVDLTKHTGLRFNFKAEPSTSEDLIISGLGIYISSAKENKVPTTKTILDESHILTDENVLPDYIIPGESSESYYDGNLIQINPNPNTVTGNGARKIAYYRYVQEFDKERNSFIYRKEMVHDFESYKIYYLPDIKIPKSVIEQGTTIAEEANTDNTIKPIDISIRIEIDQNSNNLKYAKEIGLISLNEIPAPTTTEEKEYKSIYNVQGNSANLTLDQVISIEEDYYKIFSPETETTLFESNKNNQNKEYVKIFSNGSHKINEEYFGTNLGNITGTTPKTTQISIDRSTLPTTEEDTICYINNNYEGGLSDYKHIGIQLGTDVYIPKNSLKLNLCSEPNGQKVFASLNIPTLNTVYYPLISDAIAGTMPKTTTNTNETTTTTYTHAINLSQIFKKINSDEKIKSISISVTKHFENNMSKILNTEKTRVNLFLGNIVLYKAETIPIFHSKMRFKFYSTSDGEINVHTENTPQDVISIRKIGAVLDYK